MVEGGVLILPFFIYKRLQSKSEVLPRITASSTKVICLTTTHTNFFCPDGGGGSEGYNYQKFSTRAGRRHEIQRFVAMHPILYNAKWLNCNVSFFAKLCYPLRPLRFEKKITAKDAECTQSFAKRTRSSSRRRRDLRGLQLSEV